MKGEQVALPCTSQLLSPTIAAFSFHRELAVAMPSDFNHLILTKFNILTSPKYGDPARRLQDEWLKRRLAEFETFSLPSVRGQSETGFRWLIFCDSASPTWFRERMHASPDIFEPVWVDRMRNATMGAHLRERGYLDERPLISTRLDNDDALSRDFVEVTQDLYAGQDRLYINFPRGVRACDGALFAGYWRSNPFMSLIEQPRSDEEFRGVYFIQHQSVIKTEKILNVRRPASWLRAMHSANTVKTQVGLPLFTTRSPRFDIEWENLEEPPSWGRRVVISLDGYASRVQRSNKFRAVLKKVTGKSPTTPGW